MEAVLSVGVRNDTDIKWIATGFFVAKPLGENKFQPFMVTNKHVLEGKERVVIRLKKRDTGDLMVIDLPLMVNGIKMYSTHPDENVDIAVVLIDGSCITKNNLDFAAFNIQEHALTSEEYLKEGGDEGSFVYMLGFPMGLVNVESNVPICRFGCIARMDQTEISAKKHFLLDIQNFPGNSGSPIISRPEVVSIQDTPVLGKAALIGIVCGYIPYKESLINAQTQMVVEIRSENSGIAVANPVEYIRETVEAEMIRYYGKDYQAQFEKENEYIKS